MLTEEQLEILRYFCDSKRKIHCGLWVERHLLGMKNWCTNPDEYFDRDGTKSKRGEEKLVALRKIVGNALQVNANGWFIDRKFLLTYYLTHENIISTEGEPMNPAAQRLLDKAAKIQELAQTLNSSCGISTRYGANGNSIVIECSGMDHTTQESLLNAVVLTVEDFKDNLSARVDKEIDKVVRAK